LDSLQWLSTKNGGIACGVIDVLFALTVLSLILFLQLPRRKVAAKGE
jgi:hypothetical protein